MAGPLDRLRPSVRRWFEATFAAPTRAQSLGWSAISEGRSTLLLAPTGSGKTLAAFLWAIDQLMFAPEHAGQERCRVLYISPLKALGVDVEKNLRAPLAGIQAMAALEGAPHRELLVGVRSGDTPPKDRVRMVKAPPDILITTPESLYLLLTSQARERLRGIDTVIIDEIHALASTKRGAHLFLSLERLELLRGPRAGKLQRIGLSATQRPLEEVARLLGGGEIGLEPEAPFRPRQVEIVDATEPKQLALTVEVPLEDLSRPGDGNEPGASVWPKIVPRLLELVRSHRSTLLFTNSRRLSERIAGALNELAGEVIAYAHHGSVAKDQRLLIEERLKQGQIPALVATSSLELGIDMGAIDLVIQIEAPPSVASGLQRIGRAGHQVGGISRGIIFPKFRGDLLSAAAVVERMEERAVEESFYLKNPLDVLAQQIVAMVAAEPLSVDTVHRTVRQAAPFAELPRSSFLGVLDMLSGRYPSDAFVGLRPRITWDRAAGTLRSRQGAKRIAILSGGTIPDRGLYGVFLAEAAGEASRRVGELDEEMVFESRVGEVFLLGASAWRIAEITQDRVLVTPAPGAPGKMPFWKGEGPGRPAELGRAIGALARRLLALPRAEAEARLLTHHHLDPRAAANLMSYLEEQAAATGVVPSDRAVVLERFVDDHGDWRVCILSPFGARVHAPWAMAVLARLGEELPGEIDLLWTDDGIAFRLPAGDLEIDPRWFVPSPEEVEATVTGKVFESSLFAARFRENAARALLLPRRFAGRRTPLWAQRRRASDLLAVAAQYPDFPILLETYRECLRDVFDLPALTAILLDIEAGRTELMDVVSRGPSPFAASLLFTWVGAFLYEGDAPLAERRAQALSIDQAQLRALLGEAELRELFDPQVIELHERRLTGTLEPSVAHPDALHDLLLRTGDLSRGEVGQRSLDGWPDWLATLALERRIVSVTIAGEERWIAVEDAARYRDALGVALPSDLPPALLEASTDALSFLCGRFARTHGPFSAKRLADRLGLAVEVVTKELERLTLLGRLVEGHFLAGFAGRREWCAREVKASIERHSLAEARKKVEPVEPQVLAAFLPDWQGLTRPRRGPDALVSAIEQLQGAPLLASVLEAQLLPARVLGYQRGALDELTSTGELIWRGLEAVGEADGRVALYFSDQYALLAPPRGHAEGHLEARLREVLMGRGALFFADLIRATGAFPADVLRALWALVWAGEVTNDTLAPLASLIASVGAGRARTGGRWPRARGRRVGPPGSEGRWSLLPDPGGQGPSETERRASQTQQLLARHGVLTREGVMAEAVPGGFGAIYPVLKAMEAAGRVRRGYFVQGLAATQFALAGADEKLRRERRHAGDEPILLSATDPANVYGAALPWPFEGAARPRRAAGSQVVLSSGRLLGYLGGRALLTSLEGPEDAERLARALASWVDRGGCRALLLSQIDGADPARAPFLEAFETQGFVASSRGLLRRPRSSGKVAGTMDAPPRP